MRGTYMKTVKNRELLVRTNDDNVNNNDGEDNNNNVIKNLKNTTNSDCLNYLTTQWTTLHQCDQQWQKQYIKCGSATLSHMQGTMGKIRKQTLVRPCITISRTSHEGKVTILQNKQLQTDRTIRNNEPDIMIRDNEKGTCMLIDVAIPEDRNVITKKSEKISTYR
jgi:hypothetical protein